MNKPISLSLTLIAALFTMNACATSGANTPKTTATSKPVATTPALESQNVDKAMKVALAEAEASGNTPEILSILDKLYSASPKDEAIATRYARYLREDDQISKSANILKPFVSAEKPSAEVLTETALTYLSMGEYESAKNYALKSTVADPKNARGYLALGTAQDALGDHVNAEQSFRQSLKYWQEDPAPILNNLALNLASQGHLDQALSLLERAIKLSPNRLELERNRRIIATLIEATPQSPSPQKKPDVKIPKTVEPAATAPTDGKKPAASL